ncbi:hypothetical protein TREMEDRAFT_70626 [Tremella mesenterica DSM 1558]|uniref:uncharacterized protein n=1 Tax=Tremella mesenterica (strain ATCC 24925 / CBS 8224 / DSM 1558 / NBRC 9311 / NRRL Y-6157 / RJB 2259-6 / UBC 559-6) TaxID=578456 RepID=UPI0003F48BF2|nr:uncharacterized protein TREMEDRAFT_70626 [Tremella mesenterica DSM 1558]EIW72106.1 hypothetical protein TREMEDRAFT_70626 [Tremella mesenterica DSM 1558]
MSVLSPEQLQRWRQDGYLIITDFYTSEDTQEMLNEARRLLKEFKLEGHPLTTFKTEVDGGHVGDDYFLGSNDKIRYFLETSSLSPATQTSPAKLLVPPERSINKIGHALAPLNPVFRRHTLECAKISQLAIDLGEHDDPRVLQSMIICKQPRIGGPVPTHNDSTFLYTDPPSAVGAWVALEECTTQNGCLSFLPGSHKTARISTRFVRAPEGGTTFAPVPGVEPNEEKWDEMDGWVEAPVRPGTLVLIHGSVMHRSPPNPSDSSRLIYTFHMIEGKAKYDERNWLQPTREMPFPSLLRG